MNILMKLSVLSIERPRLIIALTAVFSILFLTRLPAIKTDTNPKNMLPATSAVRVLNDEVEKTFGLYEDMLVVGVENGAGVLNADTLGRIKRVTDEIQKVRGVASRDVTGFTTIDNVTAEAGTLRVSPLVAHSPKDSAGLDKIKKDVFGNSLFMNRIISKDGKTTAIYIPLEKGADGKAAADGIRRILKSENGPEKYYVAGDPVARDSFGAEMFKLMGLFSPIAGLIMFAVSYFMFRSLLISVFIMLPAMVVIIWTMGLLVGLGFPIHIMSSMSPVFLMAIATDSIHIFNEFYFRYRENRDKKAAIIETMKAVGMPLIYTDITTAVGFAGLLLANIVPVKVFGFGVGFGTMALLLSSFTLIPALLALIDADKLLAASTKEDAGAGKTSAFLERLGAVGTNQPRATVFIGVIVIIIAAIGVSAINVNNNMVGWFKKSSEVRIADKAINASLGGTSLAYYVARGSEDDYIKTPEAMRFIEGLQRHIEKLPAVGNTLSVADYVKRINLVLHDNDPAYDAVPARKEEIAQYLFLFGMSAKPSDLDNVVDYPFRQANVWIQLKTWDVQAMRDVIAAADEYKKTNPSPLELRPAGTAYFNLVWNDEVLWDMVKGFIASMAVVFVILAVNFRSIAWAAIGYVPLLFTIVIIYGVIGFTGKDFDMPISVLSCLSLGMAVDFSIHFISRFRQRLKDTALARGEERTRVMEALLWTAARPGKGILRNAALFAGAFSVMLFAPLTPYITVGAFIVSMMVLSSVFTIIYLPALIMLLRRRLIKEA